MTTRPVGKLLRLTMCRGRARKRARGIAEKTARYKRHSRGREAASGVTRVWWRDGLRGTDVDLLGKFGRKL